MKVESFEMAIAAWKSLLNNRYLDLTKAQFILYKGGFNDEINAGWTYNYQVPKLNTLCPYVFVDKERILTMTEKEYNGLVEALILKDKQKKYHKKLKEIQKDFV